VITKVNLNVFAVDLIEGLKILHLPYIYRGRPYCGDVDIIMSPKDGKSASGFCMKLVKRFVLFFWIYQ